MISGKSLIAGTWAEGSGTPFSYYNAATDEKLNNFKGAGLSQNPSSTFAVTTSVGTVAIERFCKVVCYQDASQIYLPMALKDDNPMSIIRLVNGKFTTDKIDA